MVAINPLSPGAQLRKGCSIAVAQVDAESPPGYDESTLSTWWTPMGLLKTSTGSNVSMRSRATNEGSAHNPTQFRLAETSPVLRTSALVSE